MLTVAERRQTHRAFQCEKFSVAGHVAIAPEALKWTPVQDFVHSSFLGSFKALQDR